MHKKITSLLLVLSLIFGMVSSALPVFAEEELVDIIIEADKTEAIPGETINYDVSIGPVDGLSAIQFQLDIPDGLTFVEGSLAEGLEETLGAGECTFDSETQKVVIGDDNTTVYYVKVNAPTENGKYVIVANGYALDRNDTDSTTSSGTTYSGYKGTEVTVSDNNITSEVTETMIWDVESANGGYYIKADGQYLNAEYSSSGNSRSRAITLNDNAEAWTYTNNLLGTSDNNSNCYLIYHEDGSIFTVRSNSSSTPDNVTFYKVTTDGSTGGGTDDGTTTPDTPPDPDTDSITQANAFENGKSYIIVSNGKALKNNNDNVAAVDYDGDPDDTTGLLWTAESNGNGFALKNGSQYLTAGSSSVSLSSSGSTWEYSNSRLTTLRSNSTNYLYYSTSQNKFAVSTTASSSSSPRDVILYAVSEGGNTGNEGGGNTNPPALVDGNYTKVDVPTENGKYVIVAEGRALDRSDTNSTTSSSNVTYSGYIGTAVTVSGDNITSEVTDTMIWDVESTEGGYYIKADDQYLNAEYSRSGSMISNIALNDNAEAWSYSNGNLTTVDSGSQYYLNYYSSYSVFTVRSGEQAVTFYKVTETDSEDDNTGDIDTQNSEVALVNVTTNDVMTYDVNENTLILTFSCTVNDDFTGETKVSVTDDSYCVVNGENVSFNITDAVVNIVEPPCPHVDTTVHEAVASTCVFQGNDAYTVCNDCGVVVEGSDAKLPLDENNHVNTTSVDAVIGTCIDPGHAEYTKCDDCGAIVIGSDAEVPGPHEYVNKVDDEYLKEAADCENAAVYWKSCELCGAASDTETFEDGEPLPHNYSEEWKANAESHWHECTRCGDKTDIEEHNFIDDICDECAYEENHVHDLTLVEADEPTCTEDGSKEYYTCSECDDWFEDAEGTVIIENKEDVILTKLGHSFTNYESDDNATCTEDGTKTATCDRCDETDTVDDTDSALGHSFTNYVSDDNATCTEDGTKTATCDRCDETDTVDDTGSAGHKWSAATCTEPATCSVCGETNGEALGHDWIAATAGDARTCNRCGYTEWKTLQLIITADKSVANPTDTITYSVSLSPVANIAGIEFQIVVPEGLTFVSGALANDLETTLGTEFCGFNSDIQKVVIGGMDYTSTTVTPILTFTCTVDKGFTGELLMGVDTENWYFETSSGVLDINLANGTSKVNVSCAHSTYIEKATADYLKTPADCVNKAVYYKSCELCFVASTTETFEYGNPLGHTFADATCTEPETCSECGATQGEALGHSFTNYVPDNNATCTEDGTKTAKCDRCDETDTIVDPDTAEHKWADATCTEAKTCTVCGATEGVELGHSFTNYVSDNNATCTEDGTKTAKCDRCDETDTIVDPDTAEHKWVDATCTDPVTCSVCGETEGEALGHKWLDATCTEPKTCTVCGETDGDELGHDWQEATDVQPEICNRCGMTNNVKVQLIITADKDEAKIGESITYTVAIGPAYKIEGIEFQLDIPEGLTFVSGALVPGVQQTLGAGACNFNDKNQKVVIGGGMAYTSAEATPILTFTCTVDDEFFGDLLMSVDTVNWYIEDIYHVVEVILVNEDSEVYVACTHPDTTDHDAVASTCTVPGHEAYKTCNECGAVVEGSNEPLELDPDNHGNIVTYEAVAGTCLKPGHAEYTSCDDCGVILSGSDDPTIDPHGNVRSTDEKYLKSAADCNNAAVYYMHCDECGEANVTATFTSGRPIAHNWADATCTDPRTCTLCGTTTGNALGHSWKDATYDEPKTCERCGITEGEALAKFSVSGTVSSFGSETDAITVQLTDSKGNVVHTVTVNGNNAAYSITDVIPGTYTMTVSKNGHVTRAYTVTVGTANATQDAIITVLGDVNFDGRISLIDCNIAYNHVVETSKITEDYAFICADVNGDGNLDLDDYEMLYNHVLGI